MIVNNIENRMYMFFIKEDVGLICFGDIVVINVYVIFMIWGFRVRVFFFVFYNFMNYFR